jgi:hypothetical protein
MLLTSSVPPLPSENQIENKTGYYLVSSHIPDVRAHDQLSLWTRFVFFRTADSGMGNYWFLGVYVVFDIEELMMCIEIISFGWESAPTTQDRKLSKRKLR